MAQLTVVNEPKDHPRSVREVLEFGCGVSACEPVASGGYWRLRWVEGGRRRDTTARTRADAIVKAGELVERLAAGVPTDLAQAKGRVLVEHYLDPGRRPARGRGWSERHREEQESYCRRFVLPVIAEVTVRSLTRNEFQRVLDRAATPSVADHLRRCLTALVAAGLEEGLVLARQDVLRGVRWHPPAGCTVDDELERPRFVEEAEIPTVTGVHDLARAAAEHQGCGGVN